MSCGALKPRLARTPSQLPLRESLGLWSGVSERVTMANSYG